MLVENTLFGVRDKVQMALDRLREFEPEGGYYLAYSGGKDSTVLLDLARRSGVKFDAHYNLTTVDPPELVYFIRTQPDVIIESPEKTMWQLIVEKRMPPTRMVRYCCQELKERGGGGRRVLTGVRRAESAKRAKRQQVESSYKDEHKRYFHVIFHWSDEDVWEYIRSRSLPYCSLYDEGFHRGFSSPWLHLLPNGNGKRANSRRGTLAEIQGAVHKDFSEDGRQANSRRS